VIMNRVGRIICLFVCLVEETPFVCLFVCLFCLFVLFVCLLGE